jgi:hypothetical protein
LGYFDQSNKKLDERLIRMYQKLLLHLIISREEKMKRKKKTEIFNIYIDKPLGIVFSGRFILDLKLELSEV